MRVAPRGGFAYPETPEISMNQTPYDLGKRALPRGVGDPPRTAARGVRVPRRVRDAPLPALALAQYALVARCSNDGLARVGQAALMTALGRPGRRPDCLTRATAALVKLGILETSRPFPKAKLEYRLRVTATASSPERFDVVPYELLDALRAGQCSPTVLRTWLHLDQALGWAGRTRDACAQIATRIGISADSVWHHVSLLAQLGFVTIHGTRRQWLLLRGRRAPQQEPTAAVSGLVDDQDTVTGEAPHATQAAGAPGENAGSTSEKMRAQTLTPASPLTPDTPSFARSASRHLSNALERATGRKRPKKSEGRPRSGAIARPDVQDVLGRLDPKWTRWEAGRWRNGLAGVVAKHLDAGIPDQVLIRAINDYADLDATGGRHIPAARTAITIVLREIHRGLACRECGNGDLHELHQGLCIHCQTHDDQPSLDPAHAGPAASQEQDDLQIRATIYRGLGIPLEEIALTDPATYALMTTSAA